MRIESGRMLNDYIQPNKKQYCIPVFQRDYAWTSEQCEKLFEDIVLAFKKDREHFCGSFVYAPLPTRKHIDRYIIIDGQQRFTTLYILIKALADSATDESDKAELEKYLYNEDKFNRYGLDDKSKLKLKPVKTDNDQLQLLMAGKLDKMNKGKDGIIYHNYMLFRELIATFLAEDPDNSIMMIHDGMDSLICADIKLDQDDDAQEIFERINSTGIKLGLPDLIRNYVLMTDDDQERLYERFSGNFTDADRVIIEGIYQMFMRDSEVKKFRKYAKDNSTEMFVRSLFPDKFRDIVTQCFLDNNDSFAKLFNDPDFYQKVQEAMAQELYKALRKE